MLEEIEEALRGTAAATLAAYDPALDGPRLSYEEVDLSLIEPRKRDYTTVHEVGKRRASKEA